MSDQFDDDDQQTDESTVLRDLRKQVAALTKERDDLRQQAKSATIRDAGFDPESGPGKWFAEKYDGEFTVEELQATAEQYGFTASSSERQQQDDQEQQRVQAQQRGDRLRQTSTPEGQGQRMPFDEWRQLAKTNPAEAQRLNEAGLVDLPAAIATQLQANRQSRQLAG